MEFWAICEWEKWDFEGKKRDFSEEKWDLGIL